MMVEYGKTECKFCIYFAYLVEKVEGVEKNGWCSLRRDFRDDNDPNCMSFVPHVRGG
jgi:hypothetical protein